MNFRKNLLLLFMMVILTSHVIANGYAYYDDIYPPRRPFEDDMISYAPSIYSSRQHQTNPLWAEFWDAYNYRGPLEEERPHANDFFFQGGYPTPHEYNRHRYPQRPVPDIDTPNEDSYNRYREYFFRRYGSDFAG